MTARRQRQSAEPDGSDAYTAGRPGDLQKQLLRQVMPLIRSYLGTSLLFSLPGYLWAWLLLRVTVIQIHKIGLSVALGAVGLSVLIGVLVTGVPSYMAFNALDQGVNAMIKGVDAVPRTGSGFRCRVEGGEGAVRIASPPTSASLPAEQESASRSPSTG